MQASAGRQTSVDSLHTTAKPYADCLLGSAPTLIYTEAMTNRITLDLPEEFAKTLGADVARETLIAAVLRWFEEGKLSQGQAAEMLRLKRGEFFDLLQQHRVSPIQMTVEDLDADFARG